jgi:hypothetical protein
MIELIAKYGSITNIPNTELQNYGLERVRNSGGFILRRIDDPEAGNTSLLHRICTLYGITANQVPDFVSNTYLKRMLIVFGEKESPIQVDNYENLWVNYVRTWPNKPNVELDYFRDKAVSIFRDLNLDWSVWTTGIGCWHVDVDEQKIQDPIIGAKALLPEFRKAFTQFITKEIARPDSCLQNIAAKIGTKDHSLSAVLNAVDSNPMLLKTVVRITHERGIRKNARRVTDGEGFFHLNRIRKSLADKKKITEGVFSIGLASKNPFTILDIGNDSGCCIGIYMNGESNEFGKGMGAGTIPNIAIEPMVQMVEIKHGKDRVGSAMLFLATDKEEQVFVAINSIELRAKLAPVADKISDAVIEWVIAYSKKIGAKYTAMGVHDYNTGCFHLDSSEMELETFEGVAYRCYSERIHTDIEKDIGAAHGVSLASISTNHRMIIGNLAKLPIETRKNTLTQLKKDFSLVLVPEVLREQKITYHYYHPPEFSRLTENIKLLREKLRVEPHKRIPGSILTPRLSAVEFGEHELTLDVFSHCMLLKEIEIEDLGEGGMFILVPVDTNLAEELLSWEINRPSFPFLATLLLVKQHMGCLDPDDYGYHCIGEFFCDDVRCEVCYLEFTPRGCKLQRKIPKNQPVKHWLVL